MAAMTKCVECSLKNCLNETGQTIPRSSRRYEVCTVLPSKLSHKQRERFHVQWSRSGDATFHKECWDMVLKSARARSSKNARIKFTDAEKVMVKEAAKTVEVHDGIGVIKEEGKRIASMLKSSSHCVAFTGAGISTSAGIGDYRGKSGKWTQDDRAKISVGCADVGEPTTKRSRVEESSEEIPSNHDVDADEDQEEEGEDGVPYEKLRPTYTHEALKHLLDLGYVKYLISQNGDGLHLLSGVLPQQISELHGNVFLEKCEKCEHIYERKTYVLDDRASQYYEELEDFGKSSISKPRHAVQCSLCGLSHRTGRKCSKKGCKGFLRDTIINFRDNLEADILDKATEHAQKCDLMLCLGTTLQVTPASDLVEMGVEPLRLVICNRQKTAVDGLCSEKDDKRRPLGSRVFGDCDDLIREVMKCILPHDALLEWEGQREERLEVYHQKR